mmetsp:Transcript_7651/g.21281  ORF Transcript_7651/g.21281 Transcript_7651/m.21281 type:complete len:135 (+) Transcript_7651:236-640(+)
MMMMMKSLFVAFFLCLLCAPESQAWLTLARPTTSSRSTVSSSKSSLALHPHQATELAEWAARQQQHHDPHSLKTTIATAATAASQRKLPVLGWCRDKIQSIVRRRSFSNDDYDDETTMEAAAMDNAQNNDPLLP